MSQYERAVSGYQQHPRHNSTADSVADVIVGGLQVACEWVGGCLVEGVLSLVAGLFG